MSKKDTIKKTNAMRLLEKAGAAYHIRSYHCDGVNFDGRLVAGQVGLPYEQVFKTLVAFEKESELVVCCIPVGRKLNLKALAAASGHKRLELLPLNRLLPLTGYVRGGVSPVGMKKSYPLFLDQCALKQPFIAVSAGLRGQQMCLDPAELVRCTGAVTGSFSTADGSD